MIRHSERKRWTHWEHASMSIALRKSWGPPLVYADWHALCQAIYAGIEGEEWEELYFHCREMSKAAGAKRQKPFGM